MVKPNALTVRLAIVIPIHNISCYAVKYGKVFSSTTYSITTKCRGILKVSYKVK
jgi:hypothetical protein